MDFIDRKFKKNKRKYILQCLMATGTVLVVLSLLEVVLNAAVIAAIGASAFIAFTMPHTARSAPRFLIGGYIVGIISGAFCYYLSTFYSPENLPGILSHTDIIFCALSVGMATLIMVITNTEHPPAAGVAMGVFLDKCELKAIVVIIVGIICLSVIKTILRPVLKDLL